MKCVKAVLIPTRLTERHKTFTVLDASNGIPIGYLAHYLESEKPWIWAPYHESGMYRIKNLGGMRRHGIRIKEAT
jgi:hypothetical protein